MTPTPAAEPEQTGKDWARWALWLPGLLVALCAATATAHGLYEVSTAAGVPAAIAWLYPVITDGLALVAYLATTRLTGSARSYAWFVVVLAAGLSGLAQAVYLAGGVNPTPTGATGATGATGVAAVVVPAPEMLRFGIGAWPAIAAAIVAHLLFLLTSHHDTPVPAPTETTGEPRTAVPVQPRTEPTATTIEPAAALPAVRREVFTPPVQPAVQSEASAAVQPAVQSPRRERPVERRTVPPVVASNDESNTGPGSPKLEAARAAARRYAAHHGDLPTTAQLVKETGISRGRCGYALKELREHPQGLHVVPNPAQARTQP